MAEMPRPRPPHLHRETTRHGRTVWYVRVGKGPRIRLRTAFGSPEFSTEYQAALAAKCQPAKSQAGAGSLVWLIDRYREASTWTSLSMPPDANAKTSSGK
jgi:hypothetical protein